MPKKSLIHVINNSSSISTYGTGLLQAKAYRILKKITAESLIEYGLSSLDWALLGILFDSQEGLKIVEIAELLGVEAPFATVLVESLEKKKLLMKSTCLQDKRAKIITLTAEAKIFVPKVEKSLRQKTQHLLIGTDRSEVAGYLKVLQQIVTNSTS